MAKDKTPPQTPSRASVPPHAHEHKHSEYVEAGHAHALLEVQLRELDARLQRMAAAENVQRAINELDRRLGVLEANAGNDK